MAVVCLIMWPGNVAEEMVVLLVAMIVQVLNGA